MEDRDHGRAELGFVEPWVPLLRERDAVEIDADAVRRRAILVVASPLRPPGAWLFDRDAQQAIEGERLLHVADDDVDLLERERRDELRHAAKLAEPAEPG